MWKRNVLRKIYEKWKTRGGSWERRTNEELKYKHQAYYKSNNQKSIIEVVEICAHIERGQMYKTSCNSLEGIMAKNETKELQELQAFK